MEPLLTFDQAVTDAQRRGTVPVVLLGNGFSIDWDAAALTYTSLYDAADLTGLSVPKAALFDALGTTNFEEAVDQLQSAARLAQLYQTDLAATARAEVMERDADAIRRGLADVLTERHPVASATTSKEVANAAKFLSNFREIYTVSYDLLLYWVLSSAIAALPRRDGFVPDGDELVWRRLDRADAQQVLYLHGAVHLFGRKVGGRNALMKLRSGRTSLNSQIRQIRTYGKYLEVVTEGEDAERGARIGASPYLSCYVERWASLTGSVFTFGFRFHPNDQHVVAPWMVPDCRISHIYIGMHVGVRGGRDRVLGRRVSEIESECAQAGNHGIEFTFFDSASAHVLR